MKESKIIMDEEDVAHSEYERGVRDVIKYIRRKYYAFDDDVVREIYKEVDKWRNTYGKKQ